MTVREPDTAPPSGASGRSPRPPPSPHGSPEARTAADGADELLQLWAERFLGAQP
ncbi:hypothetical protein [Streptomyces sp. NPDC048473]|uniref:hypothetical protein n=1 Tax=unclassified Streptomyces TaxID=2593676 RepID=UPI003721E796